MNKKERITNKNTIVTPNHKQNDSTNSYWNSYYLANLALETPSPFALYCASKIPPNSHIFELGCGNGRDSVFLIKQGHKLTACDLSHIAINKLNNFFPNNFLHVDFTKLTDDLVSKPLDVVYSRFSLHAVDEGGASRAISWAYRNLSKGGLFLLEVRSVNDELYGQGEQVGKDAFICGHYRRFIRNNELIAELERSGFVIEENMESKGLAIHDTTDPMIIRVIARKKV